MRQKKIENRTGLKINETYIAEPQEVYLAKVTESKLPIEGNSPIIYTERKDGVRPEYDIRTDRFEVAMDAMDKVSKSAIAKREGINKGEQELKQSTDAQSDN